MLRSARTAGVTVTTFMPPRTATFSASVVGKSVTASRALRLSPAWRKLTMSVSPGPVSSMTSSQSRNVPTRGPARRHLGHPQAARLLPPPPILGPRDVEPHPGTPHFPEAPQLVRHAQG